MLGSFLVIIYGLIIFSQEGCAQSDVELQNVLNLSLQETAILFEPEQNTHSLMVHETPRQVPSVTNSLESRSPSPMVVVNSLDGCQQGAVVFPPPYEERDEDSPPSYEEVIPAEDKRGRPETPPPLYDDIMYEI